MMEQFIEKGGWKLRLGYTTGSCAAAAAKAAAWMLLTGKRKEQIQLHTPKGIELSTLHKAYDNLESAHIQRELLRKFSTEDLDTFYRVIGTYLDLLSSHTPPPEADHR